MSLEDLLRKNIKQLVPYQSARDEYTGESCLLLDANESPFDTGVNRYPDPLQRELKDLIAEQKGVNSNQIFLGNGSDETLDLLIRAFCQPEKDEIIILPPTYGMYKVLAQLNDIKCKEVPLDTEYDLDVQAIFNSVSENTKIIFICSPNNPTGNSLNQQRIAALLKGFKGIVVIDEAYIDFSVNNSWIENLGDHPYLFVNQTFSKSYSAAGIRLGMGFGSEELIRVLSTIKAPYNISELSQKEAIKILQNEDFIAHTLEVVSKEKDDLVKELSQLTLVKKVHPSDANFLMVEMINANQIYVQLLAKGIVVRNRSNELNCSNCLRITVGTKSENKKLINALKKIKIK